MSLDLSADAAIFDGTEAVTLRRVTGRTRADSGVVTPTTADTAVATALRRLVGRREIEASGGRLRVGDVKWHLPDAEAGASPINEGDQIRASSGAELFRVLWSEHSPVTQRRIVYARS